MVIIYRNTFLTIYYPDTFCSCAFVPMFAVCRSLNSSSLNIVKIGMNSSPGLQMRSIEDANWIIK